MKHGHFQRRSRWHKEIWHDKKGNPIGAVLVKRDAEKGQVISIIYSRKVKEKKKNDLQRGKCRA